MDSARFDALARSLSEGMTRRGLTRLLGSLTLGLLLQPIPGAAKKDGDAKQHGPGKPRRHGTGKAKGKQSRKDAHHPHDNRGNKDRPQAHPAEPPDDSKDEPTDDPTQDPTRDLADAPPQDPIADTSRSQTRDETASEQDTAGKKPAGTMTANATCRPYNDPCTRDGQCCSGKCSGNGVCRCSAANQCPQPNNPCQKRVCTAGRCAVEPRAKGTTCDDGDACTDGDHCDGQGHCVGTAKTCAGGQVCDPVRGCGGGCQAEDKQTTCANTQCGPRPNNCGQSVDCGSCDGDMVCESRQCVCPVGTTACGNGLCAKTQTDPTNCGGCKITCDGGNGTCKNGVCATPEVCDGVDNDLDGQIDEDTRCPGTKVCRNALCVCPAGTQDCDGDNNCEQLDSDQYCGSCDPCTGDRVCSNRQCVCPDGTKECGGRCEQLGTNAHCAGCNNACTGGQFCLGGLCVSAGGTYCQVDMDCSHGEPGGRVCQGGRCVCPVDTKACKYGSCAVIDEIERRNGCCSDADCPGDKVCADGSDAIGRCVCDWTHCGDNCTCWSDKVCQNGTCVYRSCVDTADCTCGLVCQGGVCGPFNYGGVCYGDDMCAAGQICDMTVSDWWGGTCNCGPNQDCCLDGCSCPVGRECQGGVCVCVATECGSECCLDGWTCQEGDCVCLTGQECGYDCCPAGSSCGEGVWGPYCG